VKPYEIVSLVIAFIGVSISVLFLIREKVTAKLSVKQMQILEREEKQKAQADIHVNLVREGGTDYRFLITNVSSVSAKDVQFELQDCPDSPLVSGDYNHKLPAPILNPGGTIRLIAAIHLGSPSAYTAMVSWTDPDEERRYKKFYLTL
jgi:hypothetical protein